MQHREYSQSLRVVTDGKYTYRGEHFVVYIIVK